MRPRGRNGDLGSLCEEPEMWMKHLALQHACFKQLTKSQFRRQTRSMQFGHNWDMGGL
jgi:hypothetical protein